MHQSSPPSEAAASLAPTRAQRIDLAPFALLLGVVGALTAFTVVSLFVPGFSFVVLSLPNDLIIDTAAVVVAGAVASRAWARHDATGDADSLFQASAFLVLFGAGLVRLMLLLAGSDLYRPFDQADPGQAPLYSWTGQRLAAAVLLLLGAITALRGLRVRSTLLRPLILLIPVLAVTAFILLALAFDDALPQLIPPETLAMSFHEAGTVNPQLFGGPFALLQLSIGAIYLAAALGYARAARTLRQRGYTAILAVALLVAVFTQLHYAVVPGTYSGLLSTGDYLRLLFYVLVLGGVAVAARRDLADLVLANASLEMLRRLDADRIVLEERTRLARDIHDGLVQDLWLARLVHGRLREVDDLPSEATDIVERVDGALESALAEARQAVVALHVSPDATFGSLLREVVEDYADRFGLAVECQIEAEPGPLPERSMGELLRICREALNNVRKHADAALTRVTLDIEDDELVLTIADNGRGFDPQATPRGYGLRGMRDRAQSIGGRLLIRSAPMDGTRVMLMLPLRRHTHTNDAGSPASPASPQ